MKRSDPLASACRHCRHYVPEGRRGGHCSQLNALVQGNWTACSLARPVFAPTWDFTKIVIWKEEAAETRSTPISAFDASELHEVNCSTALEALAISVSSEKISA